MTKAKIWLSAALTVALLGAMSTVSNSYARSRKIKLAKPLTSELNSVLLAANNMHKAFYKQDEWEAEKELIQTLKAIKKAKGTVSTSVKRAIAKEHEGNHIVRYLEAARGHLEMVLQTDGEKKQVELKNAFNQLAGIVRSFKVSKDYHIFFCSKDRSTWIQKGWSAKNPFSPKSKCGRAVQ